MASMHVELSGEIKTKAERRMREAGFDTMEAYLASLIEIDELYAGDRPPDGPARTGTIDQLLSDRLNGPFEPMDPELFDLLKRVARGDQTGDASRASD